MIGFESKSFSLLWRATRDGFGAKAFHSRCDGKTNTLTVIKSKTGFIFGGYTAVEWTIRTDKTYKTDNTAFLFTLTNPASMPLKMKIKEGREQYAVGHFYSWGPYFGDLLVSNESNSNTDSYTNSNVSFLLIYIFT